MATTRHKMVRPGALPPSKAPWPDWEYSNRLIEDRILDAQSKNLDAAADQRDMEER